MALFRSAGPIGAVTTVRAVFDSRSERPSEVVVFGSERELSTMDFLFTWSSREPAKEKRAKAKVNVPSHREGHQPMGK